MKLQRLPVFVAALGLCAFAASAVRAADVTVFLAMTIKISQQNSNTDNGTLTTTLPPVLKARSTIDILNKLARDEHAAGNWASNNFPKTAKLAVLPNSDHGTFVVMDGTNVLVDVSDIVSFDSGDNEITSGKKNDVTGLSSPSETRLQVGRITFDDTAFNDPDGGLKFFLQGLVTFTKTDSTPVNGVYTEKVKVTIASGVGEGTSNIGTGNEHPFVVTATVTGSGSGTFSL
jgi:hypothetical protein